MSTVAAEPTTTSATAFVNHFELPNQLIQGVTTNTHQLYTLPGYRSSLLTFTVLIHDVNAGFSHQFFNASYAWFRQYDKEPTKVILAKTYENDGGTQPAYTIDTSAVGNEIQITISQKYNLRSFYTIVGEYIFAA